MSWDRSNYEPVEDRLRRFWEKHPEGRVHTELVFRDEKQFVVRTEVYTDREDSRPVSVGYAEETVGSNPVNKTNALENCETSSIGRALANLNFAPKGGRPSQEEMSKTRQSPADMARVGLRAYCDLNQLDAKEVVQTYHDLHQVALKDEKNAARLFDFLHGLMGKQVFSGPPPQDEEQPK